MKSWIKYIGVITGIFLLSAVLAPFFYDFLPFKFERIFNRLVMIFSLLAVAYFVRIRKQTLERYGLWWHAQSAVFFYRAFVCAVGIMALLAGTHILFGAARFSVTSQNLLQWGGTFALALGAGILIAVIEEFFFRGFVFRSLKDHLRCGMVGSVLLTNLFYAALHFVGEKRPFIGPNPRIIDSFKLMTAPLLSFMDWQPILPAFIGLFIFGCILNLVVIKTQSLYGAMGLHAGCVFFLKSDGRLIYFMKDSGLFFGTDQLYDGILGWGFLILLGFLIFNLLPKRKDIQATP